MTTATTTATTTAAGTGPKIECLCPYCGSFNAGVGGRCPSCGTEDTTAARSAAAKKPGPWFVLQARNPDAAGLSFDTLRALIAKGAVTERSVVRGPTTGQLWRLACKVRGVARELGLCHACGHDVKPTDGVCPGCLRIQTLPANGEAIAPVPAPRKELAAPTIEAKPVPSAAREKKVPREDLLTVRDLAKAFQLDFGPAAAPSLDDLLPPRKQLLTPRRMKMGLTAAAALVVGALVGPIGLAIAGHNHPAEATPAVSLVLPVAQKVVLPMPAAVRPVRSARPSAPAAVARTVIAPAADPLPAVVAPPTPLASAAAAAVLAASVTSPVVIPDTDDPAQLWSAGRNAEAKGDFAAAVSAYERIEGLPSDIWPADLQPRLTAARSAAKADAH